MQATDMIGAIAVKINASIGQSEAASALFELTTGILNQKSENAQIEFIPFVIYRTRITKYHASR